MYNMHVHSLPFLFPALHAIVHAGAYVWAEAIIIIQLNKKFNAHTYIGFNYLFLAQSLHDPIRAVPWLIPLWWHCGLVLEAGSQFEGRGEGSIAQVCHRFSTGTSWWLLNSPGITVAYKYALMPHTMSCTPSIVAVDVKQAVGYNDVVDSVLPRPFQHSGPLCVL